MFKTQQSKICCLFSKSCGRIIKLQHRSLHEGDGDQESVWLGAKQLSRKVISSFPFFGLQQLEGGFPNGGNLFPQGRRIFFRKECHIPYSLCSFCSLAIHPPSSVFDHLVPYNFSWIEPNKRIQLWFPMEKCSVWKIIIRLRCVLSCQTKLETRKGKFVHHY